MRALGWLVVLPCCWPWAGVERSEAPAAERLLGPVAGLAASAAWVRFDALVHEGRYEAAYAVAERALALDPASPQGWWYYAAHLARFRASAESEPHPAERRRWLRAALDVLERGERRCARPGELALTRGLILRRIGWLEEEGAELGWPGGAAAAHAAADEALARARRLGVRGVDLGGHELGEPGHGEER